jgi:hypothetical protein
VFNWASITVFLLLRLKVLRQTKKFVAFLPSKNEVFLAQQRIPLFIAQSGYFFAMANVPIAVFLWLKTQIGFMAARQEFGGITIELDNVLERPMYLISWSYEPDLSGDRCCGAWMITGHHEDFDSGSFALRNRGCRFVSANQGGR